MEKQYLDYNGLANVAGYVNTRLKTVTTMPISADNGAVRLYVGTSSSTYEQGHIYQYNSENTEWVDITPIGSGGEYRLLTGTLLANAWSNNTQTVTIQGISSTTNGVIGLLDSATSAQVESAKSSEIRVTALGTNSVSFVCKNVPTVDIPFGVLIGGGGGTDVVANPTGTATGTLTSIGINGDKYDIQGGGGADYVELTQAQYDALTPAEKNNGKMYFITDGVNNGSKRIVVVTDSYGEVTNNFISYMRSMCPRLNNSNFFPFAYSSAGFVGDLVSGSRVSWKQRFIDSGDIDTVPNPETITDVLILGGSNDRSDTISVSDIMTAAQTFYGLVSNKFYNANIYVGYIGYSVNYLAGNYAPSVKRAYQDLGQYGYRPIAHANSWLHYTGYVTDNVHPNADGSKLIAIGVLNTIIGGGTDDIFNHEPTPLGLTFETGFSVGSQAIANRWVTYHYGHRSGIKVLGEFAFATAKVQCNSSYTKFATIADTYLYGANDNMHTCNCFINVGINSKNYTIPCVVKVFNKGLYIKFPPHEELPSGTSYNVTYATLYFSGIEADDIFM